MKERTEFDDLVNGPCPRPFDNKAPQTHYQVAERQAAWIEARVENALERLNKSAFCCSFCNKNKNDVFMLIECPAGFICDNCVNSFKDIVDAAKSVIPAQPKHDET